MTSCVAQARHRPSLLRNTLRNSGNFWRTRPLLITYSQNSLQLMAHTLMTVLREIPSHWLYLERTLSKQVAEEKFFDMERLADINEEMEVLITDGGSYSVFLR
ncbi:hypothetical protein DPMN_001612 [Dreissena polymorpha]|uniref:Uncharacterized protein n=1 Tax=Dreissena polymorpha TaxID=45954 RepID=A0A9D4ML81_DREPO|nr:hypothetical protein DPMN_001612 [Dreissena polymorpha]